MVDMARSACGQRGNQAWGCLVSVTHLSPPASAFQIRSQGHSSGMKNNLTSTQFTASGRHRSQGQRQGEDLREWDAIGINLQLQQIDSDLRFAVS